MGNRGKLKRAREDDSGLSKSQTQDATDAQEPATKKTRIHGDTATLFVRSLPPSATANSLTYFFSQHYPVKHATVVTDPKTNVSKGYGFVTFADPDDAQEAKNKLQKTKLEGRSLLLDVAEPRHRRAGSVAIDKRDRSTKPVEPHGSTKLIVRNLPWSVKTSDQLAALFRSFGKVKFADLPNYKGKLSGFGFVTIRGKKNAQRALDAVNEKLLDGRTLAVDWAVDKTTWKHQQEQEQQNADAAEPPSGECRPTGDDDDQQGDKDVADFMMKHAEHLEDEDDEREASDSAPEEDGQDKSTTQQSSSSHKQYLSDNSSTLFVRNLPFTTNDEELKSHFERFGPVRYARVVVDRVTGRPIGTGFVCFLRPQHSKACLKEAPNSRPTAIPARRSVLQDEMADPQGKYTLDGRILQVSQAVSKQEASRLAEKGAAARRGSAKDKRRLFLLSEGTIAKDSPLLDVLAPAEVKLREQSASQRKKLIQSNPSLHISLTRLAVRNIPRDVDSKGLKALAREAVVGFARDVREGRRQPLSTEEAARGGKEDKEAEHRRKEKGKGIVKQSKVQFENKEGSKVPEADGAGRSRGYGFIEYSSHRWALMGLRWLNGHALKNPAGKTQRLVVEFAIENAQVVARRKELQTKLRARAESTEATHTSVPKGHRQKAADGRIEKDTGIIDGSGAGHSNDFLKNIIKRKRLDRKSKTGLQKRRS